MGKLRCRRWAVTGHVYTCSSDVQNLPLGCVKRCVLGVSVFAHLYTHRSPRATMILVCVYDQMCVCESFTKDGAHSPVGKDNKQRACENTVKV